MGPWVTWVTWVCFICTWRSSQCKLPSDGWPTKPTRPTNYIKGAVFSGVVLEGLIGPSYAQTRSTSACFRLTRAFGAKAQNIGRERQARPLSRAQKG